MLTGHVASTILQTDLAILGGGLLIAFIITVVVNLVIAALVIGGLAPFVRKAKARIDENALLPLIAGIIVLFGGSFLVGILVITVVGLIIAVPLAIIIVAMSIAGHGVMIVLVGSLLTGQDVDGPLTKPVIIGAIGVSVLMFIPAIGTIIVLVLALVSIGSVALELRSRYYA